MLGVKASIARVLLLAVSGHSHASSDFVACFSSRDIH
jgi:hypothetical protein